MTLSFKNVLSFPFEVKSSAVSYSYLCICGVEEFLTSVHEETDEEEDDSNYHKCPDPVVLKKCEKTGLLKIQTAEETDEEKDDRNYDKCPEPVVINECEKTGLLKIQTAEEADEEEDDRNYDKCPEPVVLKNAKRLDF